MKRLLSIVTSLAIILVLVVGCAGSGGGYGAPAAPASTAPAAAAPTQAPAAAAPAQVTDKAAISIKGMAFNPPTLTIKKGTTVTWTNNDSVSHDVANDAVGSTADGALFKSPPLSNGQTFSFTFNTAGQIPYHCPIHANMKGTIIVQD